MVHHKACRTPKTIHGKFFAVDTSGIFTREDHMRKYIAKKWGIIFSLEKRYFYKK